MKFSSSYFSWPVFDAFAMRRNNLIFHPVTVIGSSVFVMIAYFGFMRWRIPNGDLSSHFFYVLPIILPFVAFVFDRARTFREAHLLELTTDSAIVFASVARGLGLVPLISGHALFLTYAMLRPGSRVTKITAALVMIQVIYLKFAIWHDPLSPLAGLLLGAAAAFVVRWTTRTTTNSFTPLPDSK